MSNAIAIILHLLAINIWIGGTFFSVIILPRAIASVAPAEQHRILSRAFHLFFPVVWLAIVMLLGSGGWMVANVFGGLSNIPLYVLVMMLMAMTMVAVFSWIYFVAYRHYRQTPSDVHDHQRYLGVIRLLSKINMALGIGIVVVIGGRSYFLV